MEPKAALQRAIDELGRQRAEIESLRRDKREPIAVIGMACRLPSADTPDEFWSLLDRGTDAVTEVPHARWNADAFYDADPSAAGKMMTKSGAFIRGADMFDPQFFGIAPREAQSMDPQQRILLEVAWEALEHANIPPTSLYGSATGVFIGITCFDHAIRMSRSAAQFDSYAGTGSALNMAPGRLSYVLGLTGPSMAIDTACSSSLVSLHLACQSLRERESEMALVGGVHLILSPEVMVSFSQARMLAADGRSKTFDASADGYSRGEGCGVVVLKRLAGAVADRDTILGVIRGTAINQDGPSGGLTVPNGASQQKVIRRALDAAGVAPAAVGYVEAHGTGTSLGDPIEVEALAQVYGEGRPAGDPLLVGSVKTNIGHLEPAAGMAGLIKILLAFQRGRIPRHLHFRNPNPHIPWADVPVKIAAEAVPWPRSGRARIAGLSAFGFSGTNGHVILEEPPEGTREMVRLKPDTTYGTTSGDTDPAMHLLPLSAKSDAALRALASRYASMLAQGSDDDLASICYTAGSGRAHFPHRAALLVATVDEARRTLAGFAANELSPALRSGKAASADYRRDAASVKARLAMAYDRTAGTPAQRRDALTDIAGLYLEGVAIEWDRLYRAGVPSRVALPTYPFQRERYWIETPPESPEPNVHSLRPPGAECPETKAQSPGFYQTIWESLGPARTRVDAAGDRRWTIVAGDLALAGSVHGLLREQGAEATIAAPGDAVGTSAIAAATDLVFVAGASDASDAGASCAWLLALVHNTLLVPGASPRIWIVTRGATSAPGLRTLAGAAHAPLAAFARVLGLEHPELFGRLIDLDAPTAATDARAVLAEILHDDAEDQVAIRKGERYAQRVDHVRDAPAPPLEIHADASYLITGGLGRIGLQVARYLAGRGARYLCLVGRRGVSTADQRAAVAALEAQGARLQVTLADVADGAAMARILDDLPAPLRGVVHAAGLPGYTEIAHLTAESFAAVLRPKVEGAWTLHRLTRDLPLDCFVCCSSIASAWGSRGQAHYAAGNAFLDALAHLRRASGLPAVTINWGPWVDGGMTSPEAETLLRRVGVRPLASGTALEAFGALAQGSRAQVVVADIDWTRFKGSYEARGHRRLLERIKTAADLMPPAMDNEVVRRIDRAAPADRERLLVDVVRAEVAQVLALSSSASVDPAQGLFEMGMDSLMALELRTRLETRVSRALPATLVFDCPTVQAIAALLLRELSSGEAPHGAVAPATARRAPVSQASTQPQLDLDALSDEEAEALLLKKLESIH